MKKFFAIFILLISNFIIFNYSSAETPFNGFILKPHANLKNINLAGINLLDDKLRGINLAASD